MLIRQGQFLGENRAFHPMLLPDGAGVLSTNQKPGRGDLRPWNAPLSKATVGAGRKTIYRMGRAVASDTDYWLSWTTIVHAVRGPNALDQDERTYYTGDGAPKWTDTTKALGASPPTAFRTLGVPPPSSAVTLTAAGGVATTTETRYYVATFVTDAGEESQNSPISLPITCKTDDTVTLANIPAKPSGSYGITLVRIYRTQSGSSDTSAFFFLREIAEGLTTTTDDNRVLAGVIKTVNWAIPPTDLKWLKGLWNGMLAGISGRSVRFCEAFSPYAWPYAYEVLPTSVTPVALETFGQTLVMLTDGNPSYITGGTPDAMDEQPIEFSQACVSPLSAVGMGHGVAWASPDGLAYVGSGVPRLLTAGILTKDDWLAMKPETMQGCMYEGRYFGFYNDGTRKGFMLDPANALGIYFLDFGVDALYVDDQVDALFVLDSTSVKKWDAGTALTATIKTKLHKLPKPTPGFACAEVVADAYPVTFKLYADGVLKHTQTVASAAPFRLPAGYHMSNCQVEISTTGAVQGYAMAHSMQELATT